MTPLNPFSALVTRVHAWGVESQQGARRNAMVASTSLAARRAEREDVAQFLEQLEPAEPRHRRAVAGRR